MAHTLLLTLVVCATAHLSLAAVLALYARHKVQYLSLAWIMGLLGASICLCAFHAEALATAHPGILHPLMMTALVPVVYLETIFPLSFVMPGYLQWGRMWRYATLAIALVVLCAVAWLIDGKGLRAPTPEHLTSPHSLLRLIAPCVALRYIVGLVCLPRRLARHAVIPRHLKVYTLCTAGTAVLYLVMAYAYSPELLLAYCLSVTTLHLWLAFRTLETMAVHLPAPHPEQVNDVPSPEAIEAAEQEDFNEANRQRFLRTEFFMQHKREWAENTFGRDRLCEATGINRHLMLQALRSQGYNNTHEYIATYRTAEMKRLLGENIHLPLADVAIQAGFGSLKTARAAFERIEGSTPEEWVNEIRRKRHG